MGAGAHGDRFGDGVDAALAAHPQDRGEPLPPGGGAEGGGVEEQVGLPGAGHVGVLGGRDDVARRKVGELVHPRHDPRAPVVDEEGAVPAHGLRDEDAAVAGSAPSRRDDEHRGVELEELDVAGPRPGS